MPLLGALGAAALVLVLLPLTQTIGDREVQALEIRKVEAVLQPPPPPPPPQAEERSEVEVAEVAPQMEAEAAPMTLAQLEVSLNPGLGNVTAGAFQVGGFSLQPDVMADLDIFEISELDRRPRVISAPELVKPYELSREGISGRVRLKVLIEPSGRVKVLDVISSDHPRLVRHARQFAEQCLYESPTRNGKPVAVAFILPINY